MSDLSISSSAPQFQALVATRLRQPDVTAQAVAVKAVDGASTQIAATLASISTGVDIQT